uniref:U1 small nuclear ribonucleoprotein C n=2 Tax=Pseudocrenilabrinae TaxID=318546 RepID=A0AAX7SWV9_ASTCA
MPKIFLKVSSAIKCQDRKISFMFFCIVSSVTLTQRFYCDYCDTYLTHDSPSVRKTHCSGRKHKENVKDYYQKWMEEQAQSLIDKTTAAFQQGKIPPTPFPGGPPPAGPPRPGMLPTPPMGGPPMMPMMGPPPHGMMPGGPGGMRPPMGGPMQMMPGPPNMMRHPRPMMMPPVRPGMMRPDR